jgi:hypothetical protein
MARWFYVLVTVCATLLAGLRVDVGAGQSRCAMEGDPSCCCDEAVVASCCASEGESKVELVAGCNCGGGEHTFLHMRGHDWCPVDGMSWTSRGAPADRRPELPSLAPLSRHAGPETPPPRG